MIEGVRVGHWTDEAAQTGCTVVLLPDQTVASGEIRGGAPATREFALLTPERTVAHINAVVLSGGSAFGLAAADGVVRWCEEHGHGFTTVGGKVPIVVGMSLYDLAVGESAIRPGPDHGYQAAQTAVAGRPAVGQAGAGTGATMNKWRGAQHSRPGGLGYATLQVGDVTVAALVAVNASGDFNDGSVTDQLLSGTYQHQTVDPFTTNSNTTIGVIATNAELTKLECFRAAQSGHDGLAKALVPAHTDGDGDALVVAATGQVSTDMGLIRLMSSTAVEAAIASLRPGTDSRI